MRDKGLGAPLHPSSFILHPLSLILYPSSLILHPLSLLPITSPSPSKKLPFPTAREATRFADRLLASRRPPFASCLIPALKPPGSRARGPRLRGASSPGSSRFEPAPTEAGVAKVQSRDHH